MEYYQLNKRGYVTKQSESIQLYNNSIIEIMQQTYSFMCQL